MPARKRTPTDAGALGAGLLVDACGPHAENSLRLGVVSDLALDLRRRLEALAGEDFAADSLVEAALACADLAAVHLAAGTTRALISLVESETGTLDEAYAQNTLRDARSAGWRADLAVRQISD